VNGAAPAANAGRRDHPARVIPAHPGASEHAENSRLRGDGDLQVEAHKFEIRIKGRVSEATLSAFEGLHYSVQPIETVLTGPVPDQAALHGLLERIQSLGLELVEVRRLPEP
jgi:hypothetical protein